MDKVLKLFVILGGGGLAAPSATSNLNQMVIFNLNIEVPMSLGYPWPGHAGKGAKRVEGFSCNHVHKTRPLLTGPLTFSVWPQGSTA